MVERSYRNELIRRNSDVLPFVDKQAVKEVTRTIKDSMCQIGSRKGSIVYPYEISLKEQDIVRQRLGIALGKRTTFEPIRLEEGMGTTIFIDKKGRG